MHRAEISVIVPARNAADDLAELFACLERQTLPSVRFEMVVGDDGSSDATRELESDDGRIRIVHGPPRNSYAARNRAVTSSHGHVLAFCDADCRPEPEWLERGLAALQGTDIVAGRIRFSVPRRRVPWMLIDMDMAKDQESHVREGVAETANLFVRRELFDRVGGFDATLPEHGDFDFVERCVAAGAQLSFASDAIVWHPVRSSGRSLLRAVWIYNRWYAARAAREGRVPDAVNVRAWVPFVQTVRARRRRRRSIGPDRRWLAANCVVPSAREVALALPIMYVIVPYVRAAAQLRGWWDGRRLRVGRLADDDPGALTKPVDPVGARDEQ